MDNIEQPVKPANDSCETHAVLSIGGDDYQLDPRIEINDAIHVMRLLSLGVRSVGRDYDAAKCEYIRTVGPRRTVALQLVPAAESEVEK